MLPALYYMQTIHTWMISQAVLVHCCVAHDTCPRWVKRTGSDHDTVFSAGIGEKC